MANTPSHRLLYMRYGWGTMHASREVSTAASLRSVIDALRMEASPLRLPTEWLLARASCCDCWVSSGPESSKSTR